MTTRELSIVEAQSTYCRVIAIANHHPAMRKWIIRRERDEHGNVKPWHGWIVTAPSGTRRWFFNWPSLQTLCPFFVMGEQCPPLRDEMPEIYDAGVPV